MAKREFDYKTPTLRVARRINSLGVLEMMADVMVSRGVRRNEPKQRRTEFVDQAVQRSVSAENDAGCRIERHKFIVLQTAPYKAARRGPPCEIS